MRAQSIVDEIYEKVKKTNIEGKSNLQPSEKYTYWTIGITNDPNRRKEEHANNNKNVKHWRSWPADDEENARSAEKCFLDHGMKGSGGGGTNPKYVYIF